MKNIDFYGVHDHSREEGKMMNMAFRRLMGHIIVMLIMQLKQKHIVCGKMELCGWGFYDSPTDF